MKYQLRLPLGVLVLLLCIGVSSVADAQQPNIVHILTDDFGWQDPVCFDVDGETPYETPHLDRLATRGRKFVQAYSPSPTCAPSRAAYITGQYPAHTGIYHVVGGKLPRAYSSNMGHINPFYRYRVPLTESTIATELKKAGYTTGHVGKWHMGGRSNGYPFPNSYGFDFSYISDIDKPSTYYPDPEIWGPRKQLRNQSTGLATRMKPDRLTGWATDDPKDPFQLDADGRPFDKTLDVAVKWLEKNHDQPFFLNYCTYYVHSPIQTRNRDRLAHYCKKMGIEFPTDPGAINTERGSKLNPYYATMVEELDWMIGKVITYLEETDDPRNPGHKLVDNTYIVISSDNGGLVRHGSESVTDNSPLREGKHYLHEGGVRVPFIVRGPDVPSDSVCQTPISLIDLYPTFVALAGLPPSENPKLDGCDLRGLFEGTETEAKFADGSKRESIFFHFPIEKYAGSAIRKGPWKLYRNYSPVANSNPPIELFRLYNDDGSTADLGEQQNLAQEMPGLANELLAELKRFLKEADVSYPYKDPKNKTHGGIESIPKILDRGQQEDRIWAEFETGDGKSEIVEAKLLYTVNGSQLELTGGRREMWFEEPAEVKGGRVTGVVPPGTSHAVFCMRDSEGFLVMTEDLPTQKEVSSTTPDSALVKHAYPFRPGLFALVKLAKEAEQELQEKGETGGALAAELTAKIEIAEDLYARSAASDKEYCQMLRDLRHAIRNLKGTVSQADNDYLNLFRQSKAF